MNINCYFKVKSSTFLQYEKQKVMLPNMLSTGFNSEPVCVWPLNYILLYLVSVVILGKC